MKFIVINAGRVIIKEGHIPDTVYFILTGEIEVTRKVFDHVSTRIYSHVLFLGETTVSSGYLCLPSDYFPSFFSDPLVQYPLNPLCISFVIPMCMSLVVLTILQMNKVLVGEIDGFLSFLPFYLHCSFLFQFLNYVYTFIIFLFSMNCNFIKCVIILWNVSLIVTYMGHNCLQEFNWLLCHSIPVDKHLCEQGGNDYRLWRVSGRCGDDWKDST